MFNSESLVSYLSLHGGDLPDLNEEGCCLVLVVQDSNHRLPVSPINAKRLWPAEVTPAFYAHVEFLQKTQMKWREWILNL